MWAAGRGDHNATLRILAMLEADIERLSRFMRMPREEARQALTLELLELIRSRSGADAPSGQSGRCAETGAAYGSSINLG
ncbi:hypothetical protein [Cohnella sp. 56]|uniref:hypothetical protein n=1 Tax=Cohnella sp. 56 TaxID=3113722 RepID=UPI0030E7A0B3